MRTALSTINLILSLLLLFSFLSLPTLSFSQRCHPHDLKVLRQIQQALGNPSELSWKTDKDCCSWPGITCDVENTGRVTILVIQRVQISTTHIPDVIADLPYLEMLYLDNLPNLTGEIPFALTRLTRLKTLDISWTNISGPIPSFLCQIKSLTAIVMNCNPLISGSIPPSLSSLPNLQVLNLHANRLTGFIPESFGYFPPSIQVLDLGDNRLTGPVPRSLGYVNFRSVDLSYNRFVGDVAFLFGKNKTLLDSVDLSRNKFSFDGSKVKVNSGLYYLDVNHNLISGNLPASLKNSNLGFLNVSYNRMCGEIPKSKTLQKFDYSSYFHNKCLCGSPLPPCK